MSQDDKDGKHVKLSMPLEESRFGVGAVLTWDGQDFGLFEHDVAPGDKVTGVGYDIVIDGLKLCTSAIEAVNKQLVSGEHVGLLTVTIRDVRGFKVAFADAEIVYHARGESCAPKAPRRGHGSIG